MKKLFVALAVLSWASFAQAGRYHRNDNLTCNQCHTMHASQQHGFSGPTGAGTFTSANKDLLSKATVSATCGACHDGAVDKERDVIGASANAVHQGTRSAGALNAVAGSGVEASSTDYADWMGHTLGSTAVPPGFPGSAADWQAGGGFDCADCHAVHGNVNFRNVGSDRPRAAAVGGASVTVSVNHGTFNPAYDVNVAVDSSTKKAIDVSYGVGGVAGYKGVDTTKNGMNQFCGTCHGNFHGTANTTSSGYLVRHPTSGVAYDATKLGGLIGDAQTSLVRPVYTDSGKSAFEVGCLTCHKAHGNKRAFGLVIPAVVEGTTYDNTATGSLRHVATVTNYEDGDAASTTLRNLCATCHSQSRKLVK